MDRGAVMTMSIETKDLINGKHKLQCPDETANVTGLRMCEIENPASRLASVLEFKFEMISLCFIC